MPAPQQVVHDRRGVVAGAVDEAGVPAVLEALPDHVQPRRRRHAAVLHDRAVRRGDRHPQPGVVRAVAGREQHRSRCPRPAGPCRGGAGAPEPGAAAATGHTSAVRPKLVDVPVHGVQQPLHPAIGVTRCCAARSSPSCTAAPSTPARRPAAGRRGACSVPRSRSCGERVPGSSPDQLQRRLTPRRLGVRDLVDRAGEPAGAFQPPVDVHAAVAARDPGVPPDRENHLATRAGQLVGDLHPRGGGADHQHSAGRKLGRGCGRRTPAGHGGPGPGAPTRPEGSAAPPARWR